MGIIKTLICIALILVGIAFIVGITQISEEQNDCLEEIAEDYCEDNGMEFSHISGGYAFFCMENERQTMLFDLERYEFLEDEVEDCGDLK